MGEMPKVYDFLTYKKKREEKAGVKTKEDENKKVEKPNWEKEDKINIGKLTELMDLVAELLSNIRVIRHREAYLKEYGIISSFTDSKIIGLINNFNEREVKAGPIFYSALIDMARDKKLIRPQLIDK